MADFFNQVFRTSLQRRWHTFITFIIGVNISLYEKDNITGNNISTLKFIAEMLQLPIYANNE